MTLSQTSKQIFKAHALCGAASVVMMAFAVSANAQLLHRYDFTTGANDTIGTANGTLVGTATISDGALVTAGGNGTVNGIWSGTGPRMTLDAGAVSGITGAFTIESWFTATTGWPKFDTLYAFSDTTTDNYLLATPVRGAAPWPSSVAMRGAGGNYSAGFDLVLNGIYLDTAGRHQSLVTYDGTTFSYYVDGVLANYNTLPSTGTDVGFNLSRLTSIGINGGSPWADPSLTGSTYDFRIYGTSLSADQVSAVFELGSDAASSAINAAVVPEPTSVALIGVAGLAYGLMRRRNR